MSEIALPTDDQVRSYGDGRVAWPAHWAELDRSVRPGQHTSVLGQNGSGKSHLMRHFLELFADANVLLIDTKQADEVWRQGFLTVRQFPTWWQRKWQKRDGQRQWFRLAPQGSRDERRQVVARALRSALKLGNWMVAIDETKTVVGKPPSGLGLEADLTDCLQRGRSKRVSVLAGAQSPVFLPGAFYDEARRLYVGYIADARRLKRVGEIAADADEILDVMRGMNEFEFGYVERKFRKPVQLVKAPGRLPGVEQRRPARSDDGQDGNHGDWATTRRYRALYGS